MDSIGPRPVVFDLGTKVTKVGYAGESTPRTIFWNSAVNPQFINFPPIIGGTLGHGKSYSALLTHIYDNVLKIEASSQPLLLTQLWYNPRRNRQAVSEIVFEELSIPGFYSVAQPILALYGSGRKSGVAINLGEIITEVLAVHEGRVEASDFIDVGGDGLTVAYSTFFELKNISLSKNDVKTVKEEFSQISLNFSSEEKKKILYEKIRTVTSDTKSLVSNILKDIPFPILEECCFSVPEQLFQSKTIHSVINETISKKCSIFHQPLMYSNILLAGGTSAIPNLDLHMAQAIKSIAPQHLPSTMTSFLWDLWGQKTSWLGVLPRESMALIILFFEESDIVVMTFPGKKYTLAWEGGSLFASSLNFPSSLVEKKDYFEIGQWCFEKMGKGFGYGS